MEKMSREDKWRDVLYPLKLSPSKSEKNLPRLYYMLQLQQNLDEGDVPRVLGTKYEKMIREKIEFLHSHKIIHGDLHIGNIVWDITSDDENKIRFIDFETTVYMSDMNKELIEWFNKFLCLSAQGYLVSLESIISHEKVMFLI